MIDIVLNASHVSAENFLPECSMAWLKMGGKCLARSGRRNTEQWIRRDMTCALFDKLSSTLIMSGNVAVGQCFNTITHHVTSLDRPMKTWSAGKSLH